MTLNDCVREQKAHRLAVMCPPASLGKSGTDVDGLDLVAGVFLLLVRDGVGHDYTFQAAVVDVVNGLAGKDSVHNNRVDFPGTVLHHRIGGLDEGSACVSHVINDNGNFVFYAANKNHARNFVRTSPFLMNQGKL